MKESSFSVKKRLKSFGFAFNGLRILWVEEHNSRIQLVAALLVVAAGFFFKISKPEWMLVIFCVGLVFALEIVNSAIENICDFVSPEKHELIKKVKDLSAAAVLVGAITSSIIGLIIFAPKVFDYIS